MDNPGQIVDVPERLHDSVLEAARTPSGALDYVADEMDGKADQEYHGEFRYFNKPPQELHRLLEVERNPGEIEAIERALEYWAIQARKTTCGGGAGPTIAGEPYRGETRAVEAPASIAEMVKGRKPVAHVKVGEDFRTSRIEAGMGLGMVKGPGGIWEES
jgi:hypothetical protein